MYLLKRKRRKFWKNDPYGYVKNHWNKKPIFTHRFAEAMRIRNRKRALKYARFLNRLQKPKDIYVYKILFFGLIQWKVN